MKYALITVYQPGAAVADHVRSAARQVDLVYVCDNSADDHRGLFSPCGGNVRYVWFGRNLGLSSAFNRILKAPEIPWQAEDYVLFLDQDSRIGEGHVDILAEQFERLRADGRQVGCLGPVYFNTSSGAVEMPRSRQPLTERTWQVASIITSSMLTTYGNLRQVGFWNEQIFLDLADWDLCWRMEAAGLLCCLTDAAVLRHSLGSGEKKLGPIRLREGEPFREYYQIRDSLYLQRESYTPLKFRIRFVAMLLIRSPLHVLFLKGGRERLKYIGMGIHDYRRGKSGPLEKEKILHP